jgi:serine/threonine-protein kinase
MSSDQVVVESRARARVGTTLNGKYHLERLVGVGGMASVYAATHRNNKRFAVKILHAELSVHHDLRHRFMREGYVANTVEHPGAVTVLDDDVTDDGAAFLVMELLEGEGIDSLSQRVGGKLPLRAVLALAHQLLDVLAAADAKNIIHRDIKPANLFLTREGTVKVLDFGVARVRGDGIHTHSGLMLGTPGFMAPEQALGRTEVNGRTDLWAAGATMFSLLAGGAVHPASSAQEQMVLAATRHARSLGAAAPDVPARVVAIVDQALAFEQERRWANAAEMRDAVADAYLELYGEPVSDAPLMALLVPSPGSTWPLSPKATTGATPPSEPYPGRAGNAVNSSSPHARSVSVKAESVQTVRRTRGLGLGIAAALVALAGGALWIVRHGAHRDDAPPPPLSAAVTALPPPVTATTSDPVPPLVDALVDAAPVDVAAASASPLPRAPIRRPLGPTASPAAVDASAAPADRFDHQ